MPRPSIRKPRPFELGLCLQRKAFTIVEMLVAFVVLFIVVVLVAQLMDASTTTIRASTKHTETDSEARLLFDRMGVDFAKLLTRSDVDLSGFKQPLYHLPVAYGSTVFPENLQTGNDRFAFYSETTGYCPALLKGSNKAPITLVAYMVDTDPYTQIPVLRRMSKGLGWDPDPGGAWKSFNCLPVTLAQQWGDLFGANYQTDFQTVGRLVFRIETTYLLKGNTAHSASLSITPWDTTTTPPHDWNNGFKDVAAIVVTIAVLDSKARTIVKNFSTLTSASLFPDAVDNSDIAEAWTAIINAPDFASKANIPLLAASGVRVYQRYFYLDTKSP